jgi:hypothetical protein
MILPVDLWLHILAFEEPLGVYCGVALRQVSRASRHAGETAVYSTAAGREWLRSILVCPQNVPDWVWEHSAAATELPLLAETRCGAAGMLLRHAVLVDNVIAVRIFAHLRPWHDILVESLLAGSAQSVLWILAQRPHLVDLAYLISVAHGNRQLVSVLVDHVTEAEILKPTEHASHRTLQLLAEATRHTHTALWLPILLQRRRDVDDDAWLAHAMRCPFDSHVVYRHCRRLLLDNAAGVIATVSETLALELLLRCGEGGPHITIAAAAHPSLAVFDRAQWRWPLTSPAEVGLALRSYFRCPRRPCLSVVHRYRGWLNRDSIQTIFVNAPDHEVVALLSDDTYKADLRAFALPEHLANRVDVLNWLYDTPSAFNHAGVVRRAVVLTDDDDEGRSSPLAAHLHGLLGEWTMDDMRAAVRHGNVGRVCEMLNLRAPEDTGAFATDLVCTAVHCSRAITARLRQALPLTRSVTLNMVRLRIKLHLVSHSAVDLLDRC